jgi:hypothetical protein
MTLKVEIYEVNYAVSPGGEDCWEGTVHIKLGHTVHYSDGRTAGEVLDKVIKDYPGVPFEVDVISLEAYNKLVERE